MDVIPVDRDVPYAADGPSIDRPLELAESLDSTDKRGNISFQQRDIEQAFMIGHKKVGCIRFDAFSPLRMDLDKKDLE
jgi:hypothetical protein